MTLARGRGEHGVLRSLAQKIVNAVLDGARDRSRDKHPRPVIDQQQRTMPLTRARIRLKERPLGQMAA